MMPSDEISSGQTGVPPEEEMLSVLLALRDLLAADGEGSYAQIMHDIYHDWTLATSSAHRSDLARQIFRLYGGMASFNDLVLNGDKAGRAFRSFRSRLWHLALHFVE